MIDTNKNLPYDLRTSGNEVFLDIHTPPGEPACTFNLNKLSKLDANQLSWHLHKWADPIPAAPAPDHDYPQPATDPEPESVGSPLPQA